MAEDTPVILFGAFDRHNFGDLLFPHIAAELLRPRPLVFAGLAERDLTAYGGHRVRAIASLAREWGEQPADLMHVGGEILTCSLYEAAVMLLSPEEVSAIVERYDDDPSGQLAWAQGQLGLVQQMGYLVPKGLFRQPGRFLYSGVGGVGLAQLPAARQAEVLANLRQADQIMVRDRMTQEFLSGHGIHASLVHDPAVLTAELFGPTIAAHKAGGEPLALSEHFPQGYVAVQFSADFGDDDTLRSLAAQLDQIAMRTGLGIALFRAGAAPWHDDLETYRRLLGFMASGQARLFESLHLWDICALLAGARAYCGSSLHGRIVAESLDVPAINLVLDAASARKQVAYAGTWDDGEGVASAKVNMVAECVISAVASRP